MKKMHLFAVFLAAMFSSTSMASIETFWASGTSDSANQTKYLKNGGAKRSIKNFSIAYQLDTSRTVSSAKLWIKAVDDYRGKSCKRGQCLDKRTRGRDKPDRVRLTKIEGQSVKLRSININESKWYELLDVTSYVLNDTNRVFNARLKVRNKRDVFYNNAKLVIEYSDAVTAPPISSAPPIEPGAPVPVPASVWLFGSALMGLFGLKRKPS